ncbi:MAG: esterase-like activity of phytase family protein [Kiritimatiellae bacterium]|nr:esterase-like activity of phytase family protein [Kiritimatiellia bacterium]
MMQKHAPRQDFVRIPRRAAFRIAVSRSAFAFCLLASAVAAVPASAALKAVKVSEVSRPSRSGIDGNIQTSGLTYAGGDLYYAVDDDSTNICPVVISVNRADGSVPSGGVSVGASVKVPVAHDMEGCAYDPCSGGLWIAQETSALVREFDPVTGAKLRDAPVPAIQKDCYGNFSLEALTISGDGKTMWTCNEESLQCDGEKSTLAEGTTVRLTRFTRRSVRDNWTPAGQWAYLTQPIGEGKSDQSLASNARCGVSALTALPDGTLLVLERGFRKWGSLADDFKNYIYVVDFDGATDVSGFPSLLDATYTRVKKTSIWQDMELKAVNYEGMCLGPRLSDGSCVLILVADGGGGGARNVMTLKLTGLGEFEEMYFEDEGDSEPAGGPYRFMAGTTVEASQSGHAGPYETKLRSHWTWSLENHIDASTGAPVSGDGAEASFAVSQDDSLSWSRTADPSLTLLGADSFERCEPGAEAPAIAGWSGDAVVAEAGYTPATPPGYPLQLDSHERVLQVDGETVRDYSGVSGRGAKLDAMLRVTREREDAPVADVSGQIALYFGIDGKPTLQHLSADGSRRLRTAISDVAKNDGDWVRASLVFDYSTDPSGAAWCQVRIDGSPCPTAAGVRSPSQPVPPGSWYRLVSAPAQAKISSVAFVGTGAVDDLALYEEPGDFEFDESAGTTLDGVPYAWLTANGLPWDAAFDADGDGCSSYGEYAAGTDPWDESDYLRILTAGFNADGAFQITFTGRSIPRWYTVREAHDLSEIAEIGAGNLPPAAGFVRKVPDADGVNIWRQIAPDGPGDSPAKFFLVTATPEN